MSQSCCDSSGLRMVLLSLILLTASATRLAAAAAPADPVFRSPVITEQTPGHALQIKADIRGAKELYLVVTDGGNGFGCDWADWAEPTLTGPQGSLRLTELKWKSATAQWGKPAVGANAGGGKLRIAGREIEFGIGTHANSVIAYQIPAGKYEEFHATVGLDNGGTEQQGGSSVQFAIYTSAPGSLDGAVSADRTPDVAVSGLEIAEDLAVSLVAAEPMLVNPSNIDVDHKGRIWVCEVMNYRRFANGSNPDRPEGDRILVLEDTDGDGTADQQTVFYQGKDIDSAHGVCVLGNRVLVSAGDSVLSLHDDDGDLKCDRREVLFTGIQGVQHDHGIHSFTFGPDGRLYFNFGNSGNELHYADGSIVVDLAGNEVRAVRQPYQEGMAFRCELDGSRVETLGWNFRNNWELCVDSFGSVWQSDNDDDGNRGVRINYVMEFGNYGYKDELTGAGWRTPRTNLETEIPHQHWHLNDPGVVPNLLQTGAGSPTGIMIYEGDQLPERFRNQLIHCDAGPNIVRSYAVQNNGSGYSAEINPILFGAADQWFRPSDVCVAPDGSLIVADWYDPGVGGHRQGDAERGRIFRVSMPGSRMTVPQHDLETASGAAAALKSPNVATRYLAWTKLAELGQAAESVLQKMWQEEQNPRYRARALWLLGRIEGRAAKTVQQALADSDSDLRITGLRLARQAGLDLLPVVRQLAKDQSAQVRRECAIALRFLSGSEKAALLVQLARQVEPGDRWGVEAIGIGAGGDWDAVLAAAGENDSDLIWRSRGQNSASVKVAQIHGLLLKAAADSGNGSALQQELARHFRSLDFDQQQSVSRECADLLGSAWPAGLPRSVGEYVTAEAVARISGEPAKEPAVAAAVQRLFAAAEGTSQYIQLSRRFGGEQQYEQLLKMAQESPSAQLGVEAMAALLDLKQWRLLSQALRHENTLVAIATAEAMGNSANGAIAGPLLAVLEREDVSLDVRRAAVKALGRVNNGAQELVKRSDAGTLGEELAQSVAAALHGSQSEEIRKSAMRLFPLPPSKDNAPLPPMSELVRMKGDSANGRMVFFSTGTCHKCHVVENMGRDIGPNLTEIGSKLSREAMFESVLYPSAGISHNYESWTVVLASGTTVNGLLVSRTDEAVSIKGDDAIVRTFPLADVDDLVKQKISLMPADLQKTMTAQELSDVVEFMQLLKKK